MPNVLLVCTANRCRSPMAMAILRQLLANDGPTPWQVESAGTWTRDGLPAMPHAQTVMAEIGLDIRHHLSRAITGDIVTRQQLILVMESGHREALVMEFPDHADRIALLSAMAGPAFDIQDPVAGTLDDYRTTAQHLQSLLTQGLPTIRQRAQSHIAQSE
ncbi:MAG: hypothetical protein WDZ49_07425 [Litorilinea sp.]